MVGEGPALAVNLRGRGDPNFRIARAHPFDGMAQCFFHRLAPQGQPAAAGGAGGRSFGPANSDRIDVIAKIPPTTSRETTSVTWNHGSATIFNPTNSRTIARPIPR